jgi:hypothetical protein
MLRRAGKAHLEYEWAPTYKLSDPYKLEYGSSKGTKFCDATCPQIIDCLKAYSAQANADMQSGKISYGICFGTSCRDYRDDALKKCCLDKSSSANVGEPIDWKTPGTSPWEGYTGDGTEGYGGGF